jgi:hypothetical protein
MNPENENEPNAFDDPLYFRKTTVYKIFATLYNIFQKR